MSGADLDYRHRPAKNIERHIILDACRAMLDGLAVPSTSVQYVGMGAFEFIDFQLMHRALGVERMVSMERKDVTRHTFNKPFASIEIVRGQAGELIRSGRIDLDRPTILWLDYVGRLSREVIGDVQDAISLLGVPSMVIVTLRAQADVEVAGSARRFVEAVGTDWAPIDADDDAAARGTALVEAQRVALTAAVRAALKERRGAEAAWHQVLNVHYADGARMQTVAGMLLDEGSTSDAVNEMFAGRDYYKPGAEQLDLRVPVITSRERVFLDRQLPNHGGVLSAGDTGLHADDIEAYRRVYRWMHVSGLQSAHETTWTE